MRAGEAKTGLPGVDSHILAAKRLDSVVGEGQSVSWSWGDNWQREDLVSNAQHSCTKSGVAVRGGDWRNTGDCWFPAWLQVLERLCITMHN